MRSNVVSRSDGEFSVERVQRHDQCILPTVTYGSKTCNLTKQQTLKLRTMQRAHERTRQNITWRDRKTAK